jgi:ABC-type multidrug transport system fused ATPase/permease subunit
LAVALVQATSLAFTLHYVVLAAAEARSFATHSPLSNSLTSFVQFETCLVAVSRIQEIIELPAEEDGDALGDKKLLLQDVEDKSDEKGATALKVLHRTDWITTGSIRFQNVVFKYKPELPPALNDISFRIQGGQKVGIVGRTGCGKSTALQALFRMVRSQYSRCRDATANVHYLYARLSVKVERSSSMV